MPVTGNIICDHSGLQVLRKNYARHRKTKRCLEFIAASYFGRRELRIRHILAKKKAEKRNKKRSGKTTTNTTGQNFFITTQRCVKYRVAKYMSSPLFKNGAPDYIQQLIVCNEYGCSMTDGHSHLYIKTTKKMRLQDLKQCLKLDLKITCNDIQSSKKPKDAVRYCSKEDRNCLLYNIDKDWLALGTWAMVHARATYFKLPLNKTSYPYIRLSTQMQRQFETYYNQFCKEHMEAMDIMQYDNMKLYPWQRVALTMLKHQNDRQILWIVNEEGNTGKTFLCKYLRDTKNAIVLEGGRTCDLAHAYNCEPVVCFNFGRDYSDVNYKFKENLKDGFLFSSKYDSNVKRFKPPKIICVSNFRPDHKQLSIDRWEVIGINPIQKTSFRIEPENCFPLNFQTE